MEVSTKTVHSSESKSAETHSVGTLVDSEHTYEHSSQKQSTAQNELHLCKIPNLRCQSSAYITEYKLISDKILKVKENY